MPLSAFGLSYLTAPVEIRERLAFPLEAQQSAMAELQKVSGAHSALLLSTCNRTEIYLDGEGRGELKHAQAWVSNLSAAKGIDLSPYFYEMSGDAVVAHVFRVASGLESMVLGEPQILGQVKLAARLAKEAGVLHGPLDRLFQEVFHVAKAVRSETEIGNASLSMAAIAVKLAQQLFGDLAGTKLLLIGVGEMSELAARHFSANGVKQMVVANRTFSRGANLARQIGAEAMPFQSLADRLHEFDVVMTSTASTTPIISKATIARVLKQRRHRPLFIADLAVPRDVESTASELDDLFLYTLDSLGRMMQENREQRELAAKQAQEIIRVHTNDFMRWLQGRVAVPVIQQFRERAERYRQAEVERAQRMLARGEDPALVLEKLANGLTNKFLHHPMKMLRQADEAERERLTAVLQKIYSDPQADSDSLAP